VHLSISAVRALAQPRRTLQLGSLAAGVGPGRSPSWLGFSIQGRIKALATGKTYASIGDGWLAFSASGLDTQSAADIHRDSPFDPSVVCEADFLGPILLGF
jgi:hypothetical protein